MVRSKSSAAMTPPRPAAKEAPITIARKARRFPLTGSVGRLGCSRTSQALGVLIPFEQFAALRNNQLLRNVLQITFDRRALPLEGFKSEHYF